MNKKAVNNTKANPSGGITRKDDKVMVRPQNVKLADQGKAPGQKQNTLPNRKDEGATQK